MPIKKRFEDDDLDDLEVESMLIEDRYQNLLKSIKDVYSIISQKGNKDVVEAVEKQGAAIKEFVSVIKSLPKPEVHINQKETVSSIEKMGNNILDALSKLTTEVSTKREWVHKVTSLNRSSGRIDEITSTQIK